jgi:hypothetical protein
LPFLSLTVSAEAGRAAREEMRRRWGKRMGFMRGKQVEKERVKGGWAIGWRNPWKGLQENPMIAWGRGPAQG